MAVAMDIPIDILVTFGCNYTDELRDLIDSYENDIGKLSKSNIGNLLKMIFDIKNIVIRSDLNWNSLPKERNVKFVNVGMKALVISWYDRRDESYNINLTHLIALNLTDKSSNSHIMNARFSDRDINTDWRRYSTVNFYICEPLNVYKCASLNCKRHANEELSTMHSITRNTFSICTEDIVNYLLRTKLLTPFDNILTSSIRMLNLPNLIDVIYLLMERCN